MKKKVFLVSMLLIASLLQFSNTVFAGDESDPEIIDEKEDLFGPWAEPGTQDHYAYIDIVSAWFTEDENEPDYLSLYLKVRNFVYVQLRAIYSLHWEHDGTEYAAGSHTHTYGAYKVFIAGVSRSGNYLSINGEYDEDNNIISFKVPKFLVGNPGQGDVLSMTDAWTALRYRAEILTLLHGSGELIKDWAGYGRDYTVQYDSIGVPYMHRIFGPASVIPGNENNFNFEATDPQGEDIYFYVDWGDGSVEEWAGPFSSENPEIFTHIWDEQGAYTVRAKAKDTNGYESEWVELDLTVSHSRSRFNILENLANRFPVVKHILKYIFDRPLSL